MEKKIYEEQITDYLTGNLTESQVEKFEQFMLEDKAFATEVKVMQSIWSDVDTKVPEPSRGMDHRFYTMLEKAEKSPTVSLWQRMQNGLDSLLAGSFARQLAYSVAILAIGLVVGRQFSGPAGTPEEVQFVSNEQDEVRSQLVLALLDQPSPTKRLQGVSEVTKLGCATESVISALFTTLNGDANVNVRLSAVEALASYADIPKVREGLIASIAKQDSPIVQMALADLMVILQEKKAIDPLNELLKKEGINENAKFKMEESLKHLI